MFLVGNSIHPDKYEQYRLDLEKREGECPFYGVYDSQHVPCNVKIHRSCTGKHGQNSSKLSLHEAL